MSNYKKDLEEFTYIISHDLNAPLRHIREFGKLLFKKLGDKVNDEEREYMQYMQDSVDKTEHMIASLLEYSRLDTQREDATEISVQRAVEETLELMSETIANAKAIVHQAIGCQYGRQWVWPHNFAKNSRRSRRENLD